MLFQKFNKIPRLSRDCTITEKLDGSNASVVIFTKEELYKKIKYPDFTKPVESLGKIEYEEQDFIDKYCLAFTGMGGIKKYLFAGSKNRWLDTSKNGDNYGFAKWVQANAEELLNLGEGRHFGEWWGKGIQRGYGLDEKRFSLFNVGRWINYDECYPKGYEGKILDNCPKCCSVVPILYQGMFDTNKIAEVLEKLRIDGSSAVPGYLIPEGVVIFHSASGKLYKKTIMNDEKPKGK